MSGYPVSKLFISFNDMFGWVEIYDQEHSLIILQQKHEYNSVSLNALADFLTGTI